MYTKTNKPKTITLQEYAFEVMTPKQAMEISQQLRKDYSKKLTTRNFGEMENAVLNYDAARTLALVDKQIVGAISFYFDEVSKSIYIAHVGTLMSPKGTGAELVRTAVETAYKTKWEMYLESTHEAIGFWKKLGFLQDKKVLYAFSADFKRVTQIREALGSKKKLKFRGNNMYAKTKLRVEDLSLEQLKKADDRELMVLRLKFMQLWNKHFQKCDDIIVGSLNRNDLTTKYRMLLKVMRERSLEHSTEPIDREAFKRAMQVKKVGLDIAQFEPIVLCTHAVFVKEDFAEDDEEVEVIIQSDIEEPNEVLEEAITKMLGEQLDKTCVFIYTKDFSGNCIPLFDSILRPVLTIEKTEMQNMEDSSKLGEKKFERIVPIVPLLKAKAKEEHIVYGIVYEPDEEDSQGDEANAEEIRKAAYQFMEEVQTFKVMHKGKNVKVRILENYIAPVDFKIEGKSVKKGSWVLVTRILDKRVWNAIKKGKLTGYSMAGYARTG